MITSKSFKLKPTQTKVKTADGRVFIEDKDQIKKVNQNLMARMTPSIRSEE